MQHQTEPEPQQSDKHLNTHHRKTKRLQTQNLVSSLQHKLFLLLDLFNIRRLGRALNTQPRSLPNATHPRPLLHNFVKHAHNPALHIKSQRHCCVFDLWSPQTSAHVHMQHLPPHSRLGAWAQSWRSRCPFKTVATRPSKHARRRQRSVEDPSHWFPLFCCLHVLMLEVSVFWSSDGVKHFSWCSVGNGFIVSHHK